MQSLDHDEDFGVSSTKQAAIKSKVTLEEEMYGARANRKFAIVTAVFQLLMILIYGLCVYFPTRGSISVGIRYSFFMNLHVMIFVGFSFIVTFLHRYGYSAAGYNFIIAVIVIQWSILCNAFWSGVYFKNMDNIKLSTENAISADYACATILVSFGVVLGKTNVLQLLIMALLETLAFTFNGMVCALGMRAVDMGAMYVHTFGTFFGLAASLLVGGGGEHKDNRTTKSSDLFSLLGTLFLWLFWPSANAALAEGAEQHKVIMNTLLALCSSTVSVFVTTALLRKDFKFKMSDVQNAALAGGVGIGSVASLIVRPWIALIIGAMSGAISVVGYTHVQPFLWRTLHLHDTCGINNFHGLPGILGGITGSMAAFRSSRLDQQTLALVFPARAPSDPSAASDIGVDPGRNRTAAGQAFVQLCALLVTIVLGMFFGAITGMIMQLKVLDPVKRRYDDMELWDVPEELAGEDTSHVERLVSHRGPQVPPRKL